MRWSRSTRSVWSSSQKLRSKPSGYKYKKKSQNQRAKCTGCKYHIVWSPACHTAVRHNSIRSMLYVSSDYKSAPGTTWYNPQLLRTYSNVRMTYNYSITRTSVLQVPCSLVVVVVPKEKVLVPQYQTPQFKHMSYASMRKAHGVTI